MTMLGPFPRPGCTFCGVGVGHGYFKAEAVRDSGKLLTVHSRETGPWHFIERDPYYCTDCCEENATKNDGEDGHHYDYCREDRDWLCRYCNVSAPNSFYNDW